MKNLPLIPRIILNVILFGIYFVVGSVLGMVVYGVIWSWVLGASIPKMGDPLYDKIGWVVLIVTFVVTIVFRKYFYMDLNPNDTTERGSMSKKKKHDFTLDE